MTGRNHVEKAVTLAAATAIATATLQAQEKPKVQVQIPDPGVPQNMSIEAKFVRAAYNNEGYAIIGYQVAQRSLGNEWMMLDLGTTVRSKTPDYDLKRDAHLARYAGRQAHPAGHVEEYRKGDVRDIETAGQGAARFDQLLPAGSDAGVPARVLLRAESNGSCRGTRSS